MAARNVTVRRLAASNAAHIRHHGSAEPALAAELATARITEYVRRVVAEAPPLTPEQRERLTSLLRSPSGGAVA